MNPLGFSQDKGIPSVGNRTRQVLGWMAPVGVVLLCSLAPEESLILLESCLPPSIISLAAAQQVENQHPGPIHFFSFPLEASFLILLENQVSPAEKAPEAKSSVPSPPGPMASGMAAGRLIDQEPYDRIFLDAANSNAVLEVFPLDLPGRQVPEKPTQPLIVRLLNRPETKYEVAWSAVVKIELFEQRVLQEAQQFVQQGRFEEAYEYFQYLYQHYPKMAGLDAAYQEALWQEAAHWYRQREDDRALAVLRTLWEKNKDWPNLDRAMGMAAQRLIEQYVRAEDYESARSILRQLAVWYPEHPVAAKWEGQFRSQAAALQAQAKAALEKNAFREASEAARKMIQLWPSLPGAKELWEEVRHKYPRLVVGVCLPVRRNPETPSPPLVSSPNGSGKPTSHPGPQNPAPANMDPSGQYGGSRAKQPFAAGSPTSADSAASGAVGSTQRANRTVFKDLTWWADRADWAARRTARLLGRQWMELVAPGSEGGQYRSPVASFQLEELGRRLVFRLRPNLLDRHGKELTGYRLAEVLLRLANSQLPEYRPEWADRLEAVSVKDIYTVEVTLRRAHVRPESLLSFAIADLPGPYQLLAADDRQTIFVLNPEYFASSASQPKEIVEITFSNPREALAALRAGKVDLLDRIPPTEVQRLQESKEIVVGQYALPVLHVLVLNPNRPLLANSRFRRALEYGIDREAILAQICGGLRLVETPSPETSWQPQNQPEPKPQETPKDQSPPETLSAAQSSSQTPSQSKSAEKPQQRPAAKPQFQREIRLLPGFQVLSGPIPLGAAYNDPIGYGYDRSQKARGYNPRLALALARLSWAEVSGAAQALLQSAQPTGTGWPESAPGPSGPPGKPEREPSASSTQPPASKQPPPAESPQLPISPSKQPPKAEPSPAEPLKPESAPKEKKPVADPFAEESAQPSKDKSPPGQLPEKPGSEQSLPPEKPSGPESAKPPGPEKPPAKGPADPFSEGMAVPPGPWGKLASAELSKGNSSEGPFAVRLLAPGWIMPGTNTWQPVPISMLGGIPGWHNPTYCPLPIVGEVAGQPISAAADPFSERPADPQAGASQPQAAPAEKGSSGTGADPFAELEPKPTPEQSASEKPKPGLEKPAPEQTTPEPSEKPPASKETASKAKAPTPSEKPSESGIGPGSAKQPSGKASPGEQPGDKPTAVDRPTSEYLLDMPPLVLVHPPTEPARSACRQIRRMLRRVGIPIQLQEVHPAELFGPSPPEFDIAYVELVIQEPVTDLPRLLEQTSPPGLEGSFLALTLADLYRAPGWPEVRQALYRLHQISAQQLPIVSLWQTVEYFAYRRSLEGIGPKPIRLYENVEQWRMVDEAPSPTAEKPKTPATSP